MDGHVTAPARPFDETLRQKALDAYKILDTAPEEAFDDLVAIASSICRMPMGAVTLIDRDRQWLKSKLGLDGDETLRQDAFCAHTILEPQRVLVVEDTHQDPRFSDNPFVRDLPHLRFYAGAPLVTSDGHALGSLCVMDAAPGHLSDEQIKALQALARQVVQLLELKRVSHDLENLVREQAWFEDRLQKENASLMSETRTDPLTGLGNRRALREAQQALETSGQMAWVALLDIDHFKAINDTHGHPKGDEVLVALADTLRHHVRDGETVVRQGGEEFAFLLPNMGATEALGRMEALRQAVGAANHPLPCTVSIGLACWTEGPIDDAVQRADEALYRAKRGGRNRVVLA